MALDKRSAVPSRKIKREKGAETDADVVAEKSAKPAKQEGTGCISHDGWKDWQNHLRKLNKDQD